MVGPEKSTVSVVIPFYNEEEGIVSLRENLRGILEKLSQKYDVEVLLVDDGSTDNTPGLLLEIFGQFAPYRIINHVNNRGIGAAMRTGFEESCGSFVFTMDSDCTYDPNLIFYIMDKMEREPRIDMVTASPYHYLGRIHGVPRYRRILSKGLSQIYRLVVDRRIYTYTCFFRVYRRRLINEISFRSGGFLAVAEVLVRALQKGYRVEEIPATLGVRKYGTSKARLFRMIVRHFQFILQLLGERLYKKIEGGT